jgi:hypothetical protein
LAIEQRDGGLAMDRIWIWIWVMDIGTSMGADMLYKYGYR